LAFFRKAVSSVVVLLSIEASVVLADDASEIATRAQLMQPQNRVQTFRTMDSVYSYNLIKRGGPIDELPRAPRKLDVTYNVAGNGTRWMIC
jgi:hypothetical protein